MNDELISNEEREYLLAASRSIEKIIDANNLKDSSQVYELIYDLQVQIEKLKADILVAQGLKTLFCQQCHFMFFRPQKQDCPDCKCADVKVCKNE